MATQRDPGAEQAALDWQIDIWDRMSAIYRDEIDQRFAPVIEQVLRRGAPQAGQTVLDLGCGTGSVALPAALIVAPANVIGVDPSTEMLDLARARTTALGFQNVEFREGRGEDIPCPDASIDVLLASLSLMYAIDRAAAARECARVLRPGGRFVAAAWSGPETCDIVRFQVTAGSFAPEPPAPGVGPGALADATEFLHQLDQAGIPCRVETEQTGFDFASFDAAWDALAGVTAAQLSAERLQQARQAVFTLMWPNGDGPRHFNNQTQFIVGTRE
jgi:ubiquinone/menaquinone biosynthesis C-methylase UbiE